MNTDSPTKTRKTRSDSTAELSRIIQGSTAVINPPAHIPLEEADLPFWENVVSEFARADWTEHQLELAAMLARSMSDLELNQRELRKEGFVLARDNGSAMENPRSRTVSTLMNGILAQRRSLALHSRGRYGTNGHAADQRQSNKKTEDRVETDEGADGLLA